MSNKKTEKTGFVKPPIVVVLGHVDHGKTLLLDYIRKSNKVAQESGGITQHIGAYQIEHNGKKITFIDTPGHEAFSAMRLRGAKVADIAILVVAAEEGVKAQTKEAIKHIKEADIPLIVAINKIDKSEAQPERVKQGLMEEGIIVEDRGGEVPFANISAKTGQGVEELLEVILLVAERNNLTASPEKKAIGVVVESHLDSLRGPTASLLITDGTLKTGDCVLADSAAGVIKRMENENGKEINEAGPATPAVVVGLKEVPGAGESFSIEESAEEAVEKLAAKKEARKAEDKPAEEEKPEGGKVFEMILKADVQGSLEALKQSLENIKSEDISLRFISAEVGDVNNSDIKSALAAEAKIFAFRVKALPGVDDLARRMGVRIYRYDVIYELIQKVREAMSKLLEPEIVRVVLGRMKVLAIFRREKTRMIIGGKVVSGEIKRGARANIIRIKDGEEEIVGAGKINHLQHNKKDADTVEKGKECGILFDGSGIMEEGDILEVFKEEKNKREL